MGIHIQNKKIELIQWVSTLNDESIIERIMKLRESEKIGWWEEISKEGIKDADSGKLKSHSEARKLYEKWL